jgi:hypothetical protein
MDASHSSKLRRPSRDSDAAQTLRHSYANAAVAPAHTSGGKTPKLDPLLGLDFRNVLGDALTTPNGE